jgi:hypothetical protein
MEYEFMKESQATQSQLKSVADLCSEDHPCDDCTDLVNDEGCYDPCSALCDEHDCEGCQQFSKMDGGFSQQEAVTLWQIGIKIARNRLHG